jgi:hypothetical protein
VFLLVFLRLISYLWFCFGYSFSCTNIEVERIWLLAHHFFFTGSTASVGPGFFFSFMIIFTDGRTPWASDQPVPRPLPKYRTTQTQNKHIHIPNIHALCAIRTHYPSFRASEYSACLRPLGYRNRQLQM